VRSHLVQYIRAWLSWLFAKVRHGRAERLA